MKKCHRVDAFHSPYPPNNNWFKFTPFILQYFDVRTELEVVLTSRCGVSIVIDMPLRTYLQRYVEVSLSTRIDMPV